MITAGGKSEKFESEYLPKLAGGMQGSLTITKPELALIVPTKVYDAFAERHSSQMRSLINRGNIDVRTIEAEEYTKLTGRSTKSAKEQETDWDKMLGKDGGKMDPNAIYAELKGKSGMDRESAREWINWTRDNAKPITYAAVIAGALVGLALIAKNVVDNANALDKAIKDKQQQFER